MAARSLLILSLVIALSYGSDYPDGFDLGSCTPPPNDGGKKFPELAKDYVARFEWNDHILNRSVLIEDFLSVTNNIGAVYLTGIIHPQVVTKYITQAATGELFVIFDAEPIAFQDGNCEVKKLSSTESFALPFKKNPKIPGSDTLVSGRSLLTMGVNPVGSVMYTGTEYKYGILCDVWIACLYLPEGQITMNATYHFYNPTWHTAGGGDSVPVSIHIKGVSSQNSKYDLEQTFKYAYFSTTYPSKNPEFFARVFETPKHAYCPGRVSTFGLPNIPDHFEFRAEVINSNDMTVLFTREWYDFEGNYTRMDFKNPPTGNDTLDNEQSPSTLINDFNTGVSYIIDKFSKKCTVKPIVGGEFDSLPVTATKARMKSPKEFFDFGNVGKYPYQYMGEHLIRNVPCNGWISYRPFPFPDSKNNATYEWFFATKDTIFKAQQLVENLEPMRQVIRSAELNVNIEINLYRFSESVPDARVFDVRHCFQESGSTSFDMQLTGNGTKANVPENVQLLRYWFQLSVEAFSGVRPIRVQDIEFTFDGNKLGVRFTLLGPAPIAGDAVNNIDQAPLLLATNRLTESFTQNQFRVFFLASPSSPQVVYQPIPKTLRVIERKETPGSYKPATPPTTSPTATPTATPTTTPTPDTNNTNTSVATPTTSPATTGTPQPIIKDAAVIKGAGISSGEAAGLAFGMLFAGILLAVVGILLYRRVIMTPTPYTQHHNDTD